MYQMALHLLKSFQSERKVPPGYVESVAKYLTHPVHVCKPLLLPLSPVVRSILSGGDASVATRRSRSSVSRPQQQQQQKKNLPQVSLDQKLHNEEDKIIECPLLTYASLRSKDV